MTFAHDLTERGDRYAHFGDSVTSVRHAPGGYMLSSVARIGLVKVSITGFWDEAVMRRFAKDLVAEVRKVDGGENRHVMLVDLSGASIQSQAVFDAFSAMLKHGPTQARKLALYTSSLPMRMQARRVTAARKTIAMFECESAAMSWLMDGAQA